MKTSTDSAAERMRRPVRKLLGKKPMRGASGPEGTAIEGYDFPSPAAWKGSWTCDSRFRRAPAQCDDAAGPEMDPFRKSRTLSLNSAFHCKRTVGFIESAMPADGIPRCHSPRTETSARPVSKSSAKADYTIPRPSKRDLILAGA